MALITERPEAASTGLNGKVRRILEVILDHIHDRCPMIMGCVRDCSMVPCRYATDLPTSVMG